jgi:hypothetical protein
MATPQEPDFPPGHPARCDYDPSSPEAREWMRTHSSPKGERDYPVDHPKACDTPGHQHNLEYLAGVDPLHPELEPFTGRTAKQVAAIAELNAELAKQAKETAPATPGIAPAPPVPGDISLPVGQPGV